MNEEIVWLPIEDIGLDDRPTIRRVRPVDPARVNKYKEEARPVEAWTPRHVRAWPASDPYPSGEEGRPWQVISGTHSTLAARTLGEGYERLPVIIRDDVVTDEQFIVAATVTNFHGKEMDKESLHLIAVHLRDVCGLPPSEIAKRMQMKLPTIYNWLSNRDTNKSKQPSRTREADDDDQHVLPVEHDGWTRVTPAILDAKRQLGIQRVVNIMLGSSAAEITPEEWRGYIEQLRPDVLKTLIDQMDTLTTLQDDIYDAIVNRYKALYGNNVTAHSTREDDNA